MILPALDQLSEDIAKFIKCWLIKNGGFKSRSFYGEAFTLDLLARTGLLDTATKNGLLASYEKLNKTDSQFHWEFNNYALSSYYRLTNDSSVLRYLNPLIFKNTPCTNWTLLRNNTRIQAKTDVKYALKEAKDRVKKYQLPSGLILDDKDVKSFQYHCFSLAMIGEIFEATKEQYFLNSFRKGLGFIRNFILSNGDTLYIGRGQEQSFGYAALIYVLALGFKVTRDNTLLGDVKKVTAFIRSFQRPDGSLPLVMNGLEPEGVEVMPPKVEHPIGWYPYNNYFDYLPFSGFFITKATQILRQCDLNNPENAIEQEYSDKDFLKVVRTRYQAVLSRPGGYWTNDLPIPYIIYKGRRITPCYGGEQFQKSIYSLKGLPIPYCETFKVSLRQCSMSIWVGNRLFLFSVFGLMIRSFSFFDSVIDITTRIYSFLPFSHRYLVVNGVKQRDDCILEGEDFTLGSDRKLTFDSMQYSATGQLSLYKTQGCVNRVSISLR